MQIATISDFARIHKGKTICVMGGSSSLALDVERINADVWISANEHGTKVRAVDYMVAMDDHHGKNGRPMLEYLRDFSDAPVIGKHCMSTWPGYPRHTFSGMVAVWVAWMMGAKLIVLAGMDGYNGKENAMRDARLVQDFGNIRCMGGPLSKVFPLYDPEEKIGYYRVPKAIDAWLGIDDTVTVEAKKPTTFNRPIAKGERFTARRFEIRRLLEHRVVVEVG